MLYIFYSIAAASKYGAASRVMYQAAHANEYADDVLACVLGRVDEVVSSQPACR